MARDASLLVALLASLVGCYPPDERPVAMAAGECAPDGDLCSVDSDCSLFDGSSRTGTASCVAFGDVAECTGICYADADCEAGCCGALVGTSDYGVCGPCSADLFQPIVNACLQGVEFFCGCGDTLGVPCGSDRALFEESCASGAPPTDTFICLAELSGEACGDALDAC